MKSLALCLLAGLIGWVVVIGFILAIGFFPLQTAGVLIAIVGVLFFRESYRLTLRPGSDPPHTARPTP